MVIGDMRATLANGQVLNVQFASRFVVDDDDNDNGVGNNLPRLSLVQVFAVWLHPLACYIWSLAELLNCGAG
jgi:hypothetical protein